MYFKDKLINTGILRRTNPLKDQFLNNRKKADTVIV